MKKIEAIIRPEKMMDVKDRLVEIGIGGMTVSDATGWSKHRELHLQWRGQKIAYDLLPKVKLEILVPDPMVDKVVQSIIAVAKTEQGREGDGIITISTIDDAINIATSVKGERAIMHSSD
jgi:nitrogen regulatory protein P-II 1